MPEIPEDREAFLALSDERDQQDALRQQVEAEAFRRGQAEAESRGYARAIADVKRAQHQIVDAVRLEGERNRPARGGIWEANVRAHGGTEYGGAGKPRVPVPDEWWMTPAELREKQAQKDDPQQQLEAG